MVSVNIIAFVVVKKSHNLASIPKFLFANNFLRN